MAPTIPKLRVPIDFDPAPAPSPTNLVINPSVETDLTGWQGWINTPGGVVDSFTRELDSEAVGDFCAEVAISAIPTDSPGGMQIMYLPGHPVVAGERVFGAMRAKVVAGTGWGDVRLYVRFVEEGVGILADYQVDGTTPDPAPVGEWVSMSGSAVAPAGADQVSVLVAWISPTSGSDNSFTARADAALIVRDVAADFSTPYFDGDSPGFEWLGEPNGSASRQIASPRAAKVVEQDSDDELAQCVYALLATPLGSRLEDPAYGVEDATFEQLPVNLDLWRTAIAEYEPRAEVATEQELVELVDEIKVRVGVA